MKRILFVISSLLSANLINCEPEPSYGVPSLISRQQNNIQGLHQQQQQPQQTGFIQMYRSDSKYMNQMTTTETNRFNSVPSPYPSQTTYSHPQQQSAYPTQQSTQSRTTFEIQPSYGYDLGSIHQQESNQQSQLSTGHDIYGSPPPDKSNQPQELNTGESFLHPQSTPYYPNNQYISPSSPSPPPPAPTPQQELPLPPTPYSQQPNFNPQQPISNDISPPSSGLNAPLPSPSAPSAPSTGPTSLYNDDNSYQPTGYDSSDGYYPPAKQTVHKHIYVHIPPKEFDDTAPRQHFKIPRTEKHYKIIFIKTPTPPQPQPVIPPIPQNEEKTLIYVLHKKPEEPEDITIPTPEPTQPSKPEVYFIKYKTKSLPALYGAPTAPSEEDASAAAGNVEHSYPPSVGPSVEDNRSQYIEPRNNEQFGNNGGIEINNSLYNSTITNLHRYF